ncbi:MAG: hypothetical protein R3F62_09330 [Planctomycetota bacterium]
MSIRSLAWLLALGASLASAQEAPPQQLDAVWTLWRTSPDGEPAAIGSETVTTLLSPAQRELRSTTTAALGPQTLRMTQRLVVDPSGAFVRYRLEAETHRLECVRAGDAIELTGTVMGGEQQRTLKPEGLVICLDNLCWSHYDVLGLHAAKRAKPFEFTALVPQALVGIPGRFSPGKELQVLGPDGVQRNARRGKLVAANLLVEFVYDAQSGVAYRVEVPAQRLLARREGWRLADEAAPTPVAAPPAGVRELELTLPTPGYEPGLPAKLTLPAGDGPFPTAVFLSGSGPHDMDSTIGPNAPLRDLAWQLASRGVASFRWSKRTFHALERLKATNGEAQRALSQELADMGLEEEYLADARAACAFLRARPEVRGDALVVVGHSLGALLAPEVAEAGQAQAAVLLAGPGRPDHGPAPRPAPATGSCAWDGALEEAEQRAQAALEPLAGLGEGEAPAGRFLGASLAYWQDVEARDPVALVRELELPVCVVWGERDAQVTRPDFSALEAALAARARDDDRALSLPGLNHLFMPCEEGSGGEEYAVAGEVDPALGDAVAAWILQVTGGAK